MATEERNHGGDEQEDEKMEQFFALLRNFREARNKRKHELSLRQRDDEQEEMKKNKTSKSGDDERSSWVPKFEWEDFTAEIEFRSPPLVFPTPYKKKQEEDDGLDLNLTLSSPSVQ